MSKTPLIKTNTNFQQFKDFAKLFKSFKKDIATPKAIGLSVNKDTVTILQGIARDLRIISQIQIAIISNSKRFKDVFKDIDLKNVTYSKVIESESKKKFQKSSFDSIKKTVNTGIQHLFTFSSRMLPMQSYGFWNYGRRTGKIFQKTRSIFSKVNNNPLVIAMKKLTMAITRLTIRGVTNRFTKALNGMLGAIKAIPVIGGMAVGLATGGLFGIGAATNRSTNLRTQTRETGLTSGQLLAGKNVLSPYIDFEGIAKNINSERTNLASIIFRINGRNESTSDILIKSIRRAAAIARNNKNNRGFIGQNQELPYLGISAEQAQALGQLSPKELEDKIKQYKQESIKLNQSDPTLKKLQNLNTNIGITSDLIKNKFALAISAVAPKIEQFGKYLQDLFGKMFSEKNLNNLLNGMQKAGDALQDLMKKLMSGGNIFDGLKKIFYENMIQPLKEIFQNNLIQPLKNLFDNLLPPWARRKKNDSGNYHKASYNLPLTGDGLQKQWRDLQNYNNDNNQYSNDNHPLIQKASYTIPNIKKGTFSEENKNKYMDSINKTVGLPDGFMQAIRHIESSGNDFARAKGSTALGAFQMTKAARADYNVKNPFNFYDIATGAGKDFEHLMRVYHDPRQAAVAFNWGEKNLSEYLKRNQSNWEANLKAPQRKYLHNVDNYLSRYHQSQNIQLNVNNNTGGSASVNARMAAGFPRMSKGGYSI